MDKEEHIGNHWHKNISRYNKSRWKYWSQKLSNLTDNVYLEQNASISQNFVIHYKTIGPALDKTSNH